MKKHGVVWGSADKSLDGLEIGAGFRLAEASPFPGSDGLQDVALADLAGLCHEVSILSLHS